MTPASRIRQRPAASYSSLTAATGIGVSPTSLAGPRHGRGWLRTFRLAAVMGLGIMSALRSDAAEWRKVETRFFTVISQASERDTLTWARRLEEFRESMERLFPTDESRLEPVMVVIFKRDRDLAPFKPANLMRNPRDLLAFFQRAYGRNVIAMSADSDEEKMGAVVFHEATHWYFSAGMARRPTWVEEGLAEVFSTFHIDGNQAIFGGDNPIRVQTLRERGFLYVRDVMNAPAWKVHNVQGEQTAMFYAHAWLLMNYIFIDKNLGGPPALERYLEATNRGMPYDHAFEAVFHCTYEQLDQRLYKYYDGSRFGDLSIPVSAAAEMATIKEVPATADDVDTSLAFILILQGRLDEALQYVDRVRARSSNDPRADEGMAEIWEQRGDANMRNKYYADAVRHGSTFYPAHLYPQIQSAFNFMGMEAAADAPNETVVRQTIDGLKQAVKLRPSFQQPYDAIAGLMGCVIHPAADDHALLIAATQRFPNDDLLQVGLAACEMNLNLAVSAKNRLDAAMQSDDPRVQAYAKRLLLRLKAMVDLVWLDRSMKGGDLDQAQKFVDRLARAPLFPDERQRIDGYLAELSQQLNLTRAEQAMADKQWPLARILLEDVASRPMSPAVTSRQAALLKRLPK